ncbi:MAG: M1 family aminopeptidase [Planctomycetota bacterium]|nr:M1 family aminopeptidase [Planctomycetota bacterium]
MKHLHLELNVDFQRQKVQAQARLKLHLLKEVDRITLDAVELDIRSVRLGVEERELTFHTDGESLVILLGTLHQAGAEIDLVVDYSIHRPKKGMYFVNPTGKEEGVPRQVWTQSEPDETRHWIPCVDHPEDKLTVELKATVPRDLEVLSNGKMISRVENDKTHTRTVHFRQSVPHSVYLTTFVAGDYVVIKELAGEVPLQYFVSRDEVPHADRTFGKTGAMMLWFQKETGVPYPYEKYAQITVRRFMWGGMEHTGATTLTSSTIHDERSHWVRNSDGLVAHELAHQWFGNLVTCRSWGHLWLNEGFATYYTQLWMREDLGQEGFRIARRSGRKSYLREASRKVRPIVSDGYGSPYELFDSHSYSKGAAVLHMLRSHLGEDVFRRGVKHYLKTHRARSVTTRQLRLSMEEVSGQDLGPFFDQWIHKPGHPILKIEWKFLSESNEVRLVVEQIQDKKGVPSAFRFPVGVKIVLPEKVVRKKLEITKRKQVFLLECEHSPLFVNFDEGGEILADIRCHQTVEQWIGQLKKDKDCIGRLRAAIALKEHVDRIKVVQALGAALRTDPTPSVRQEIVHSLAKRGGDLVCHFLLGGLSDEDAGVRANCARHLGQFSDIDVRTALKSQVMREPSYSVLRSALLALVKAKDQEVYDLTMRVLVTPSFRGKMAECALVVLKELRDKRSLPLAMERMGSGHPFPVRRAAIELAVALGKENASVRKRLRGYVEDPDHRIRRSAVLGLGRVGGKADISYLKKQKQSDPVRRVLDSYDRAIGNIEKRLKAKKLAEERGRDALLRERIELERERLQIREKELDLREKELELREKALEKGDRKNKVSGEGA